MKYGDYLYGKGDFDNAIKQYVETIGHLEPSTIIKKVCIIFIFYGILENLLFLQFLDGPRIPQLCYYLEILHQRGLAIGQHTTLLLSAYVKLNAVQKLGEFIEQGDAHLTCEGFDSDAAIKVVSYF
jgi:hypothetical protein